MCAEMTQYGRHCTRLSSSPLPLSSHYMYVFPILSFGNENNIGSENSMENIINIVMVDN